MSIVAAADISGFFHGVIGDALKRRGVAVTDGASTYLVGVMADYARPDHRAQESMDRPLAFLLDEALHTAEPGERFERLRTLGDNVLYTSGFFSDHFEARGVDQRYLIGIGTTAYGAASSMLHVASSAAPPHGDLFGELAQKFDDLVHVVAEVADLTIARAATGSKGLLKLYERWLKTGSESLAQELSCHGFVPTRGTKGLQ